MNLKLLLILLFSLIQQALVGQPTDFSFADRLDKKVTEATHGAICVSSLPCPYGTVFYEYDDRGNLIREFDDNLLQERIEQLYEYDSKDRITKQTVREYSDDNVFIPKEEKRRIYNSQGQLEQAEVWTFVNGSYVPESTTRYEYNAAGNGTTTIFLSDYNEATNQWETGYRSEDLFDTNQKQIGTLSQWRNPYTLLWTNDRKGVWIYDLNNLKVETIIYKWNTSTDEWEKEGRYLYSNDSLGRNTQQIRFIWDSIMIDWTFFGREIFVYNNDGKKVSSEYFNYQNSTWQKLYKSLSNWDGNGNLTTRTNLYTWSSSANQYIAGSRVDYQYLEDRFPSVMTKYEMGLETNYQFKATERFKWSSDDDSAELISPYPKKYRTVTKEVPDEDGTLVVFYTTTYHYSRYFERSAVEDQSVWTFPNPASSYLVFSLATQEGSSDVSIFDGMGRLVAVRPLVDNQISVWELASGVYFYRLEHEGQQWCGKFIKQ